MDSSLGAVVCWTNCAVEHALEMHSSSINNTDYLNQIIDNIESINMNCFYCCNLDNYNEKIAEALHLAASKMGINEEENIAGWDVKVSCVLIPAK